jgi:hypothetical protein
VNTEAVNQSTALSHVLMQTIILDISASMFFLALTSVSDEIIKDMVRSSSGRCDTPPLGNKRSDANFP